MILEDVLDTAAYARAGYTLASFKEAALPLYVLTVRVLTLDRKPLNPIEEGCLKAVSAGLTTPNDVSSFLGLPRQVLNSIFAALNARECINYTRAVGAPDAQIALTVKGRSALSDLCSVQPQERIIKLVFDPLLKRVAFVPTTTLYKPRSVKENGWMEIPLCGAKRPEVESIPLWDIDKVLRRLPRKEGEQRELLALRRIERREMNFIPCMLLFYRANKTSDVQVAFHLDDGFSMDHEQAFRELGGPQQIGADLVLEVTDISDLDHSASSNTSNADALAQLEAEITASAASSTSSPSGIEENPAGAKAELEKKLRAMTQRPVRCHEHPRLLQKALTSSAKRLLIVSPWITDQVVNDDFVNAIESLLKKKVQVYIGYGLAENDGQKKRDPARQKPPISARAQQSLTGLQNKYSNMRFSFIGNTHRKHLVSDGAFAIVSSFNWLSFRGDPKRKARDELGYLVTEPADVERLFADGLELLEQGYEHPPVAPMTQQ